MAQTKIGGRKKIGQNVQAIVPPEVVEWLDSIKNTPSRSWTIREILIKAYEKDQKKS